MEKGLFIGIDLTSSAKRPTACVGLNRELHLAWHDLLSTDSDILEAIQGCHPDIVAIDSPIGLPQGLCCLEESCSCRAASPTRGRICERELSRRGIPCYYTTKRSIIKDMVYRAMGLKREIGSRGVNVIEVYPYAAKVALFGRSIPSKMKPTGVSFLRDRLAELMPQLVPHVTRFNHDLCDALVAAYTAYLYTRGEVELLGDPDEGAICVPASGGLRSLQKDRFWP